MRRIRKRWWLIGGVGLLMVALAGWRFQNRRIPKPQVQTDSGIGLPIEVVTFNAHLLPPIANQWVGNRSDAAHRVNAMAEQLARYDVVGICEAFDERLADWLIDRFNDDPTRPFSFVRSPPPARLTQLTGGGLLLLSRLRIVAENALTFSCGSRLLTTGFQSGDGLAAKGAIHARIQINDQNFLELDCFLTHLDSHCESMRATQLQELADFIRKTRRKENPLLVMGDFNIVGNTVGEANANAEYERMMTELHFESVKIFDVGIDKTELAIGTSDPLTEEGGSRIDYIFLGLPTQKTAEANGWTTISRTLRLLDGRVAEGSLSDHAAVWCRIEEKSVAEGEAQTKR